MRRTAAGLVLGYHGCDLEVAERLLAGDPFRFSLNEYDWLGSGTYFWENDAKRGLHWAEEAVKRKRVKSPAVVGAVIDLGLCLDLTTQSSLEVIRTAYQGLRTISERLGEPLVKNIDDLRRPLDNAVINYLYESMPAPKFQTVRGMFTEGGELYPGAGIQAKTHVQIAVRDLSCIRGVFRPSASDIA
jgi:hypothetical protein